MDAHVKRTLKLGIRVGVSLGAIVGLVGCGEQSDEFQGTNAAAYTGDNGFTGANGFMGANGLSGVNGLSGGNGLTGANGLMGSNGLSAQNGLSGTNGLSALNGYMTTDGGRKVVSYIVKCALASGDTLVKQDQTGFNWTFAGGIGLCPQYKYGGINGNAMCQQDISACLMAHVNTAGVHIPIWLDSAAPAINWGVDPVNFPKQEGTFFGNVMMTGNLSSIGMPTVNAPAAYFCDGDSFVGGNQGVVAGRLGKGQNNAPYANPYGDGSLCVSSGGSVGQWSSGRNNPDGSVKPADGYTSITASGYTFNHPITVWRNPTYVPNFDQGYIYRLSPSHVSGMSIDVANGSTNNGTTVQMYNSWDGSPQKFNVLASGSNWKITMSSNNNKCVGPRGNSTANYTAMEIQDCNGSSYQAWSVVADASMGGFQFKNVASGRCLDVAGASTSAGAGMIIWDCKTTYTLNQRFKVQAY